MRTCSLDVARLVFALLVVTIHIPTAGFAIISPLAYLSVPFFYVLTGYFIYSEEKVKLEKRLTKSLANYASMWIKYFLILTVCAFVLKIAFNNPLNKSYIQFVDLFWTFGNCELVELVEINGHKYGISALWFLYGGMLSLAILYSVRKFIFKRWFSVLILVVWVSYAVINYQKQTPILPRTIGASIPYIYLGIILPRINFLSIIPIDKLIRLSVVSIFFLYVEYLILQPQGYARLMLLPSIILIFCTIKKLNGGSFVKIIPVRTSFDIYIWHRLVYALISGAWGWHLFKLDFFIVFLLVFFVSWVVRLYKKYLCVHYLGSSIKHFTMKIIQMLR